MKVIWRPVDGFSGFEVSTTGQLRTWNRHERKWRNPCSSIRETPKILRGTIIKHGYKVYMLRKEFAGKPHRMLLHRLVALAFLGKPLKEQTDVAHLDGNPTNNHVSNLRWTTHRENQMMMADHGTMQYGEKSCTCKLTSDDIKYIREAVANGPRGTQRRMMEKFGVGAAQINRIVKGSRWRHLL